MKKGRYVRKCRKRMCLEKHRKRRRHLKRWIVLGVILILFLAFGITAFRQLNMRFSFKTKVNGINCSLLTVSEATEKLENELSNQEITFKVLSRSEIGEYSEKEYVTFGENLSLQISKDAESLFEEQKETHEKNLETSYVINEDYLKEYLSNIHEFSEESFVEPENASWRAFLMTLFTIYSNQRTYSK